jgi:hypothetical protein
MTFCKRTIYAGVSLLALILAVLCTAGKWTSRSQGKPLFLARLR